MIPIQFLIEWAVRSSIVILAGSLLVWLLRVKNPSIRLMAWTVMLASSLAIPFLTTALPKVPLDVRRTPVRPSATFPSEVPPGTYLGSTVKPDFSAAASPGPVAARPLDWMRLAAALYMLAAGALLLRLVAGVVLSLHIVRRSRSTGILAEGTEVRESGHVASPVTIGILRPAMLLPLDWRGWDSAKLDAVMAHERSHIRRLDPAVQLLSAIHRALLWANPLSWFLHRSIVRTAEEISDDDAIAATGDRVSYAEILLEVMQRGACETSPLGVPMARYDRPEKRVRRILNSTAVPPGITRWSVAAVLALGAPLAYLAAAVHPESAPMPAPVPAPVALAPTPVEAAAPTPAAKPAPSPAPMQAAAPQTAASPALPEFEIASVKPSDPSVTHLMGVRVDPGGRVVISYLPLKTLIATAFRLSYWQISGGDAWTEKDEYDIEAKPSEAMRSSIKDFRYTLFGIEDEQLSEMLQALLIDRFQLKFHRETKTGDVYLLQRNGKPLALRPLEIPTGSADPDSGSFGSIGYAGGQWGVFATSMPQLAKFASDFILHVPVLDRTALSGRFNYRQRVPDLEPKYSGDQSDSFLSFMQELGLKLERAKGPVETLVIDHAAKPSPN